MAIKTIKSWKEATKPFREVVKKSNFSSDDLKMLIDDDTKSINEAEEDLKKGRTKRL